MNSKWQIYRVGLVDFWYYDEEEFYFADGRMLLRGANGSGKSVTMQSFIPLLLDGNMRPERLDPFGSRARKMENYLLEEGDGREERTGYLYMELKRTQSEEFLTLGIGMRARKNKKMDSWYFCITDGRRVGKDIYLYKDVQTKLTCTMRELKNRIGDGGQVMETQSEYAQCVNRLLFGFETQEEYKELLELLIQLRTPKLSKDFKPTVINEILSGSLQTLSEDDLRPMSEAIENMDNMKTNLDSLRESIAAAKQIEKVYDRYNELVLYRKAKLYVGASKEVSELCKKAEELRKEISEKQAEQEREIHRYETLVQEEKVLQEEKASLADNDATRLKEQEIRIRHGLEDLEQNIKRKQGQESDKREKLLETESRIRRQKEENELCWETIEECLEEMESELEGVPFDDFAFMKDELCEKNEEKYSFEPHRKLLNDYTQKVENGKAVLSEEKECQERYSRFLQELDEYRRQKDGLERQLSQYENQLHEIRQELIERIYQWGKNNEQLHVAADVLQEISRKIEAYHTDTDYWEIKNLGKPTYELRAAELSNDKRQKKWELDEENEAYGKIKAELAEWENKRDPEPERSEAVLENRRRLDALGISYLPFYKAVDFEMALGEEQRARLEEALLQMGVLDALIISSEYREQVLAMEKGACDRYLFTDASYVHQNLQELFDVDNEENDIFLYQKVSKVLSGIGWNSEENAGTWVDGDGNYRVGILEGTVTKNYEPCFIGASTREQYRLRKIEELTKQRIFQEEEIRKKQEELKAAETALESLEKEWRDFPAEHDLKIAAKECERQEEKLGNIRERIEAQQALTDKERKNLDETRMRVQEICQKCYITARLDLFEEALEALKSYREELANLQSTHTEYVNGIRTVQMREEQKAEMEDGLDEIRYELGRLILNKKESERALTSVLEQLALTDYEKIRERLEFCVERLAAIPQERDAAVEKKEGLRQEVLKFKEKLSENEAETEKAEKRKAWMCQAFEQEYRLGYVEESPGTGEAPEKLAAGICAVFNGKFGNTVQMDLEQKLQEAYHIGRANLLEYQITLKTLFESSEEMPFAEMSMRRVDISAKYRGVTVKFKELIAGMEEDCEMRKRLLDDKDRELFEDILANTISKKIRARIQASRRWVEKMNGLMESMRTSSGLTLSLRWKNKRAEKEEQLDTGALVELLNKDAEIMRPEEAEQLSRHFRSKIEEARKAAGETANVQSFHAIMREILDYRQWFEFQLECRKTGEKKRELTDRVFFTFSGGEKAMAMYVPLFSAVVAKYAGARSDAPKLISLDEAFAGVDEMNIRDMFRLMVEFDFNFMINSQILWGDYDTVPALAIYQLVRPENAKFVTVIRYLWNGTQKRMVTEKDINEG